MARPRAMGIGWDIRLALRGLVKSPGFALLAVATLALGIGANTAIYTVLRAALLQAPDLPDPESLVVVGQGRDKGAVSVASYLDFVDWRRDTRSLAQLAAWHDDQLTIAGERPERLQGVTSSANLLATLGVSPALGRGFAPDEDRPGKNRVVVMSWQAWQRFLGGAAEAVGKTVVLDDVPYTLIGVLPRDFRFPMRDHPIDAFIPMPRPWDEAMAERRSGNYLYLVGRLAPGAALAAARAELDAQAARQALAYPADSSNRFIAVRSLHSYLVAEYRTSLLVLFAAVAFVLLIACVNVANLLLARATARQREMAIRLALGAGRGRVARQLLVESLVLSLAGGGLGALLALWGLDGLRGLIPSEAQAMRPITIDGGVLAFTLAVATLTGVVFGLFPALRVSATDPQDALREASHGTAGPRHQRARSVLVAAEIAIASVLLAGAGLMIESFRRLSREQPGFTVENLVTSNLFLPEARYNERAASSAFYEALQGKLAELPGVSAVAVAFPLPFSGMNIGLDYLVEGEPPPAPGHAPSAPIHPVSPGYFATLEIPVLAGRTFARSDDRPDVAPVTVVSRSLARRHFGEAPAVGRRLSIDFGGRQEWYEIIGVVGDVRGDGGEGLAAPPGPEIYLPFGRAPFPFMTFALRTPVEGDWTRLFASAVKSIDGSLPVAAAKTMAAAMRSSTARQRLSAVLLGIFGALSLLLAVVGVYGVMSYVVAQRRQEIGIRMALGARAALVSRMIVGQALRLAAIGVALGLGASLALGRLVERMLYRVAPSEPLVLGAAAAFLVMICVLAAYLPARRAARVDPMVALRSDG